MHDVLPKAELMHAFRKTCRFGVCGFRDFVVLLHALLMGPVKLRNSHANLTESGRSGAKQSCVVVKAKYR